MSPVINQISIYQHKYTNLCFGGFFVGLKVDLDYEGVWGYFVESRDRGNRQFFNILSRSF